MWGIQGRCTGKPVEQGQGHSAPHISAALWGWALIMGQWGAIEGFQSKNDDEVTCILG